MSGSKEESENRYYGPEDGTVTDNADPEKLGRCKLSVPGIIDETDWALPLSIGGGAGQRGLFDVPEVGADVVVWFHRGDPHGNAKFLPAHWGRGEGPTALGSVAPEEAVQVQSLETERWLITLDDRSDKQLLRIEDKKSGDRIELDGARRKISMKATGGVSIQGGAVDIIAARVTINGRPVSPTGGPI